VFVPVVQDVARAMSLLVKRRVIYLGEGLVALRGMEREAVPFGAMYVIRLPTGAHRPEEHVVRVAAPEGVKDVEG